MSTILRKLEHINDNFLDHFFSLYRVFKTVTVTLHLNFWEEMNCNREICLIFCLIIISSFHLHLVVGEKGILSSLCMC